MKRMHKQKEREKAITDGHKGVNKELPDYLKTLVDVDGDGQIDPEEMALMKELEHVEVRDVDGDGQISAEEIMLARKMAGKKLLAEVRKEIGNETYPCRITLTHCSLRNPRSAS
jgi:Ca2+-binding EF-hand superfamily protein